MSKFFPTAQERAEAGSAQPDGHTWPQTDADRAFTRSMRETDVTQELPRIVEAVGGVAVGERPGEPNDESVVQAKDLIDREGLPRAAEPGTHRADEMPTQVLPRVEDQPTDQFPKVA
jgi:hypothetical protein